MKSQNDSTIESATMIIGNDVVHVEGVYGLLLYHMVLIIGEGSILDVN